jgi:hypothetical protein
VTNGTLSCSGKVCTLTISGGGGLTVGTTTIASGTTTKVLFDNAGVLGEYAVTGTGNAVLSTLPTLTTSIINGTTNTAAIASTGYSLTGSSTVSMLDFAGTLNTSGSPDVFALRVTDTARGASTKLLNIYAGAAGATTAFSVDRLGVPSMGDATSGQPVTYALGVRGTMFHIYGIGGYVCTGINAALNTGWFCSGPSSRVLMPSGARFGFQSTAVQADADPDTALTRSAAASLQMGLADAASPVAQTFRAQSVVAGSTNIAGATWTLIGSLGTSQGAPGAIDLQTGGLISASGTTQQTAVSRTVLGASKVLTNNTVTTVVNVTDANNTVASGFVDYTVEVFNGTDLQYESGSFTYGVTNKGGTIANNTITQAGASGVGVTANYPVNKTTSGTLVVTWAISAANPALLSVNANSSLTPSTGYPRVTYTIRNLTQQAIAIQ